MTSACLVGLSWCPLLWIVSILCAENSQAFKFVTYCYCCFSPAAHEGMEQIRSSLNSQAIILLELPAISTESIVSHTIINDVLSLRLHLLVSIFLFQK